jgi:ketosteroid isomerase-like protein
MLILVRGTLFTALLAAFAGACGAVGAQPSADPALAPIAALKAAFNANDDNAVQALFTSDGVCFDEVKPYRWTGPRAALQWLHDDGLIIAKNGVKHAQISIAKPTFIHRSATSIYTVSPLVDSYIVGGRPQRETGLLTIILVKSGSAWKISLLGFAKQSDTSDVSWR